MRKFSVVILSIFVVISLCSCDSSVSDTNNCVGIPENNSEPSTDLSSISDFENSDLFHEMTQIIHQSFSDYSPEVSYDSENALVNIILTAADGTASLLNTDTHEASSLWSNMTTNLSTLSLSGYELLSGTGLSIGCSVMLLSDENIENALFAALNGIEIYNAMIE